MKKLLVMATMSFLGLAVNAQGTMAKSDTTKPAMVLKEHVCTKACKSGQHMYVHGEKGHTCTEACKKMEAVGSMQPAEHVCTKKCKNNKHVYAHGEKGHTCTEACRKNNM